MAQDQIQGWNEQKCLWHVCAHLHFQPLCSLHLDLIFSLTLSFAHSNSAVSECLSITISDFIINLFSNLCWCIKDDVLSKAFISDLYDVSFKRLIEGYTVSPLENLLTVQSSRDYMKIYNGSHNSTSFHFLLVLVSRLTRNEKEMTSVTDLIMICRKIVSDVSFSQDLFSQ